MRQALIYIKPAIRLIVGNALILVALVGSWLLHFRFVSLNVSFIHDVTFLLMLVGTPVLTTIHWIRSGITFHRMGLSVSRLAVNLLLAEAWAALLYLLLYVQPRTDYATYLFIGILFVFLLAIGMPIAVVVSFARSKMR